METIGAAVERSSRWMTNRYRTRVESRLGYPVVAAVPLLRPWFLQLNLVWAVLVNGLWLVDRFQPDPRFDGWIGQGYLAALSMPLLVLMFVVRPWSALVATPHTLEHRPTAQYQTSRLKPHVVRLWTPASAGITYERKYWLWYQLTIDGREYIVSYVHELPLGAMEKRFAATSEKRLN
jgi:hypothetical protein